MDVETFVEVPHSLARSGGREARVAFALPCSRTADCAARNFKTAVMSSGATRRFGMITRLYFRKRAVAVASFSASTVSGVAIKRASQSCGRAWVTPTRSGPILSPPPMVWQAAQCDANRYRPRSLILSSGAAA